MTKKKQNRGLWSNGHSPSYKTEGVYSMDKYLIINADDFGMCRAANLAVMDLLKSGSITSSTIMAPCPWAYEACQFAKKNPQFAIGVHLTFTSEWATYRWSPVGTSNTDSLRDELGFMHPESIDFYQMVYPA